MKQLLDLDFHMKQLLDLTKFSKNIVRDGTSDKQLTKSKCNQTRILFYIPYKCTRTGEENCKKMSHGDLFSLTANGSGYGGANCSISNKVDHPTINSFSWQFDKEFSYTENSAFWGATSVAVGPNYIAVADNANCSIHTYSGVYDHPTLRYRHTFPVKHRPFNVAISADGKCFVTDESPVLSVYDSKGKSLPNFATCSSNLGSNSAEVLSVTQDEKRRVIVGERVPSGTRSPVPYMQNRLSVYCASDGSVVKIINIDIAPWYIASAPNDRIIVSPDCNDNVRIYDIIGGTLLRMLKPPDNISRWCPSGVCCSRQSGDIFVANREGDIGVYRFAMMTGEYMGCITKAEHVPTVAVSVPRGMTMCKDGKTLLVADWASIKVFSFRRRGSRKSES